MSFTKITSADRVGKGNTGLPDTPLLTTTEMQEQMDSLPNLAIDKFNSFIDELEAETASQSIGCEAPVGITVVQKTLGNVLTAVAAMATASNSLKHSHDNKASLDALTSDLVTQLTEIATILSGIETIEANITDTNAALPTSKAVMNYVANANIKGNILNTIYPIGAIYQTTTTDPDTLFGTSGKWTLINTSYDGIKTYKRTS